MRFQSSRPKHVTERLNTNYLGVAQEPERAAWDREGVGAIPTIQTRHHPGVAQQQSMWLLTTLALVQVQPPGRSHLDVAQEESTCFGCKGPLVRIQSSRPKRIRV